MSEELDAVTGRIRGRREVLRAQGAVGLGLTTLVLPAAAAATSSVTVVPPAETDVSPADGAYTPTPPTPLPPVIAVTTTTATTSTATITTDSDDPEFSGWNYAYSTDDGSTWTTLASSSFTLTGIAASSAVLVRKSDGTTTATSRVDLTPRTLTVVPTEGIVTFTVPSATSGVRSARFTVLGGRGGVGGNYSGRTGGAPAQAGYLRQVLTLPAGTVLKLRAGYGGTAGGNPTGGSAGTNGLSRSGVGGTYAGGAGSNAVAGSGRGGGGGGGAASVVQIGEADGAPLLVAGGSGGGGGASSGSNGNTGRNYDGSDRSSFTTGETGFNRTASGGNVDFAGHGGGGGGYFGGGTQDASLGQNQGVGGRTGGNYFATSGDVTLDGTYEGATDGTAASSTPGENGFIQVAFLDSTITLGA